MSGWQDDAREFGRYVRQGGWRLGLLVARNCGAGQGKVPVAQFAIEARIGTSTVSLYLRAWELAANENLVPHAVTLSPTAEPVLDTTSLPDWRRFYRSERQLTGRTGSIELHPDPDVMKRRMEGRPDAPQIAKAVTAALQPGPRAELASALTRQAEAEHVAPPVPPRDAPVFVTVESVQRVLNALQAVRDEVDRLPPVMTTHSKKLLARAAADVLPTVQRLTELEKVPMGAAT